MKRISMIAMSLLVFAAAMSAAAKDEKPTSRPMAKGELMNKLCPVSGEPTVAKQFVAYADTENEVFARIYFCCENCVASAKKPDADLKALYTKAFLTPEEGKAIKYGKMGLKIGNDVCPISADATDDSLFINYNGAQVNICCPGCTEEFHKDPDKYLHNVNNAIDKALMAKAKAAKE